jgi:hypothetical protein
MSLVFSNKTDNYFFTKKYPLRITDLWKGDFMAFIVSYSCEKYICSPDESKFKAVLMTTEYTHENDVLIHQHLGDNQVVRLNNLLNYSFKGNINYEKEQFFAKKTYKQDKQRKITKSSFEAKLEQFSISKTFVTQEIVIDYPYTGKSGKFSEVQIVINIRGEETTSYIDFIDPAQYVDFVCPDWLVELIYQE